MPQELSERPEELIRQWLVDNLESSQMHGYDPQQTNPSATDFIPVTSDWSNRGNFYPLIYIGENDGPTIPNSGNTNSNGLQGDGSGVNQTATHTITLSVQVMEGGAYLDGTEFDNLAQDIYSHIHSKLQTAAPKTISEGLFTGVPTPPTPTRNQEQNENGSTETWYQLQGQIPFGVIYTP